MATITYLTKIQFDFGAVSLLAEELAGLGVQRPLLVTDPGIVACGLLEKVRDVLPAQFAVTVFDQTPENPTEAAVLDGLAAYRAGDCDGVVGLGGGSSLDLAKAVRLLASHEEPLVQYAMIEGGVARIRAGMPSMAAIPTTAGTGSEVGRGAVIVMADGRKLSVVSPRMIPDVALCDPELTLGLPPRLTAATGLDAIAHCIETFLSPLVNPPAEAIALDGLARAIGSLETAVADGTDREARWQMMMAAMEGAMAFQKGLGAVHAMSHPLGALPELKLHHGTLNAVVMPAVLRFNADHVGDKMARLAAVLGLAAGAEVTPALADLNRRLAIPAGLAEMGVEEAWL
ncbi:MAG: iron-containing alcohol dehydrogenase, partial [Rhodospirillales bacterium]|nr:iron-containing alcohol dehydrogenase [Rhodospirillales bacterium]